MMRSAIAARQLTRSDRAKICSWVRHVKKRVRAARRGKPDDYLVRGDDDLSEVIVDYSCVLRLDVAGRGTAGRNSKRERSQHSKAPCAASDSRAVDCNLAQGWVAQQSIHSCARRPPAVRGRVDLGTGEGRHCRPTPGRPRHRNAGSGPRHPRERNASSARRGQTGPCRPEHTFRRTFKE
jgi:hypothetical protein